MSDANTNPPRPTPVALRRRSPSEIEIEWSDGEALIYRASKLRAVCPCATCRERRAAEEEQEQVVTRALPVLSAAEAKPLTIEGFRPVGNYAYNIQFGDGHSAGIFTLEFLRSQGAKP